MSDDSTVGRGILRGVTAEQLRPDVAELARARSTLLGRKAPPPPPDGSDAVVTLDPRQLVTESAELSFTRQGWLASGSPPVVWHRRPSPYQGNKSWRAELVVRGLEQGRTYVYEWTVAARPWLKPDSTSQVLVTVAGVWSAFPWPQLDFVAPAVIVGAFVAMNAANHTMILVPDRFAEFSFYEVVLRAV